MSATLHIKKNDQVKVIAGKEKRKTGKILTVMPKKGCVLIEKVNFVKRHTRPSGQAKQGGILEKEAPIHISNVMVVCNKCNSPVRVGQKILEDGKKARYCKKCGELSDL